MNRRRSTRRFGCLVDLMRLRPVIPSQISLQSTYLATRGYANSKNNIIQKDQPTKAPFLPPSSTPQLGAPDSGLRTLFLALAKNGILLNSFSPLGVTPLLSDPRRPRDLIRMRRLFESHPPLSTQLFQSPEPT